jgi:peptidyl-prolyl cis-trans isomerase D
MGVMEKMRKSTSVILWVLIFSFGLLWMLADTQIFDALQVGPRSLGQVNGEPITLEEYNNRISSYIDQYTQQTGNSVTPELRAYYEDQAWEDLVTSKLIQQKMDELGISVTDQEVVEMITGENPDPFIRQQFSREDGSIDRVALQAAIEAPENSQVWILIEEQMRQKRRQQKMTNYIQSAMVVSSHDIEQAYIRNNSFADIAYIRFPYAEVSDSAVTVSEEDLRTYYNNHQDEYQREESYRFEFVSFDKTPTSEDTMRTINELENLRQEFAQAEDDSLFLVRYQSATPFSNTFVEESQIREEYKTVLELKEGEVSEVIKDAGRAFIIKKLDEQGDSVKFAVLSFPFRADPINTIDKRAEEADDFSFFAEESGFEEEAARRGLEAQEAFATKNTPFIPGIGQSRQIMDFLNNASEGEISEPIELAGEFVVLHVTEVIPEGVRPFEEVENQIRTVVTNNKRKEMVEQKVRDLLGENTTLEELAGASGKEIITVDNLSMNSEIIQGAGREPKIVGAVFGLKEGERSAPLKGTSAVFVVKVQNRQDADLAKLDSATREQIRQRLRQEKSSSFAQAWMEQLKQNAEIEDYRSRVLQQQ